MSSFWGEYLHLSIFGESHGPGIGGVIDNLPPGQYIDPDELAAFTARRAPGRSAEATARKESDRPEFLSGLFAGRTSGTPLAFVIRNEDRRSADYEALRFIPRPGHADLSGKIRYRGANDPRGGGHFSGRLTAPICLAGGICRQILARQGIRIYGRIKEIAGIEDAPLDLARPPISALRALPEKDFPVLSDEKGKAMRAAVAEAAAEGDSVGGIAEVLITGVPAGLGDPLFGGLEPRLASFIYAVPAVKALSFGAGFEACRKRGSENNDSPQFLGEGDALRIRSTSNNAGGIDGGIANGMPIVFQAGVKPTPSIRKTQKSIDLRSGENTELSVKGRHDPCIVPRALPVFEAAAAFVLLDMLLLSGLFREEAGGGTEHA